MSLPAQLPNLPLQLRLLVFHPSNLGFDLRDLLANHRLQQFRLLGHQRVQLIFRAVGSANLPVKHWETFLPTAQSHTSIYSDTRLRTNLSRPKMHWKHLSLFPHLGINGGRFRLFDGAALPLILSLFQMVRTAGKGHPRTNNAFHVE